MYYWVLLGFGEIPELEMTQVQVSTAWCRFEWMWKVHCYPGSIRTGVCVSALLFPQHSELVRRLPSLRLWAWKLSSKTGATELWEGAQIHTLPPEATHSSTRQLQQAPTFPKSLLHFLPYKNTHMYIQYTHMPKLFCSSITHRVSIKQVQ